MNKKSHRRCLVKSVEIDLPGNRYRVYQVTYDVNHSLIRIYPKVSPRLMSTYRGTCPALFPELVKDIQNEVY